jgi:mannose-1-phosphate guanylyltransferase/mannose-1-phosphate guanylyltransferase/mannose-6-phosphate isomerase
MLVLTSDHIITPLETFRKDAAKAAKFAAQRQLVVFGISPTRPETGYGYSEAGVELTGRVYAVSKFLEKPDQKTANKLAACGRYFWNSGMFAFDCGFLTEEFHRQAGSVIRPFERLQAPDIKSYTKINGLRILENWTGLDEAYRKTKKISFDYAIAVNCQQTAMIRGSFNWADIGSWDEYAGIFAGKSNSDENVFTDETCGGCFVDSDIPVALAGVKDIIVVIRSGWVGLPGAALIVKKGASQKVRDIVEHIKKTGKTEIL